jgi:hypothetical protein
MKVNDNALCAIIIKESAPLNEKLDAPRGMALGIKDFAFHCHSRFGSCQKPSCASRPDNKYPGHPRVQDGNPDLPV